MPFFIAAPEIATMAHLLWETIQIKCLHNSHLSLKYYLFSFVCIVLVSPTRMEVLRAGTLNVLNTMKSSI